MANRDSGSKLMMAGLIIAFIAAVLGPAHGRRRDLPGGIRAVAHHARFVTAPP
jgi:hypothetical protein